MNAREIGLIAIRLGAGRFKKEDQLDYGAGLVLHKKVGNHVETGDSLATIYTSKKDIIESVQTRLLQTFSISENVASTPKLIDQFIDQNGKKSDYKKYTI